jgi:hypothetical protein
MSNAWRIVVCAIAGVALAAGCGKKVGTLACKGSVPRPKLNGASTEPVLLRYRYKAGEKVGMDIALDMNMKIDGGGAHVKSIMKVIMGAQVEFTDATADQLTGEMTFTRAGVDVDMDGMPGGGGPTSVHWTSDQDDGPEPLQALKAMIGPKIPVKISTRGELISADWHPVEDALRNAGAAPDMVDSMANDEMLKSSFIMLPEKPVKVGDEWDAGELVKKVPPAGEMKVKYRYGVAAISADKKQVLLQANPAFSIDGNGSIKIDTQKFGSDVWLQFDSDKGGVDEANIRLCMDLGMSSDGEDAEADIDMNAQYKETRL